MNRSSFINQSNSPNVTGNEHVKDEDEKKLILSHQADQHMRKARGFYRNREYMKAVDEFKTSLKLRQSFIGRYDSFTAGVYFFIGNCYYQMEDYDNALVAYRVRLRIRRYLSHDPCKPYMDNRFFTALQKKGLSIDHIKKYDFDLTVSNQFETVGDCLREQGDFENAIKHYKRVVKIEKKWLGNQVTVAFLWRKIAFLVDRINDKSLRRSQINWSKADCFRDGFKEVPKVAMKAGDGVAIKSSTSPEGPDEDFDDTIESPLRTEKRISESDVFEAIKNLADATSNEVDWDRIVKAVDVKVDMKKAKEDLKRRENKFARGERSPRSTRSSISTMTNLLDTGRRKSFAPRRNSDSSSRRKRPTSLESTPRDPLLNRSIILEEPDEWSCESDEEQEQDNRIMF